MRLGIHHKAGSFSDRWISYCDEKGIPWKMVDCYDNSILEQLADCNALMWHINQNNPKELLFAKQLIYSLGFYGKKVFPDFNTVWHFDDKVGQKYLLEAIKAPIPDTEVFYDKFQATTWAKSTKYPIVFKLRSGAGSQNVRLVNNFREARRIIRRAFSRGFNNYYALGHLKESWRTYFMKRTNLQDLLEAHVRVVYPPPYARVGGRERGYVYFQKFVPGNKFDIRTIVIGDKAFAIKRIVRKNDFRASGSGVILYDREHFDDQTIQLSFNLAEELHSQCTAFDFIYDNDKIYVVEISFGFSKEGYDSCPGYWDKGLNWHTGQFNPYGWMVDNLIKSISKGI